MLSECVNQSNWVSKASKSYHELLLEPEEKDMAAFMRKAVRKDRSEQNRYSKYWRHNLKVRSRDRDKNAYSN